MPVAELTVGALSPITLRFRDPELERLYCHETSPGELRALRAGLILAILIWVLAGALLPFAIGFLFAEISPVIAFAIAANLAGLMLSPWASSVPRQQWLGAAVNSQSGLSILYLSVLTNLFERFAVATLLLGAIFAFMFLRLRFLTAVAAALTYLAGFTVAAVTRVGTDNHVLDAFLLYIGVGVAAAAAYALERSERRVFSQSQVITWQQRELALEKDKSDRLLLNVLPAAIADRLKASSGTIADGYPEASILFSDLVGFTPLTVSLAPQELLALLDELFAEFDAITERLGLEKIKTIGDGYEVVAGLPNPRPDHAQAIAEMALEMRRVVDDLRVRRGVELHARIGLDTGPVIAGVIGRKKFVYEVWGDAVNTSSRMESHGLPDEIQLTEAMQRRLVGQYQMAERGVIDVKGKGLMRTFLLIGRQHAVPATAQLTGASSTPDEPSAASAAALP